MIIFTAAQMKIIKEILRNMQVIINSNKNNFCKVLVKTTSVEWVEKETIFEHFVIVTPKDIIKWFYYKGTQNEMIAEGEICE